MKRMLSLLVLCTLAYGFAPAAHAQSCSLTSGTGTLVNFSSYTATSGTVDAQGTLTMSCGPLAAAYSITIGKGTSTNWSPRILSSGGNTLNYNLYTDLTRLILWGDGSLGSGTSKQSGVCVGSCSVFVYGRLPGGQSVPAGTYTDQVQVTVNF